MATANTYSKGLLNSWKEGIEIFKPKNLKIFLLVTLNVMLQSLKCMIVHFWPLLILFAFVNLWYLEDSQNMIIEGFQISLLFLLLLSIRPSVHIKNMRYFMAYVPYIGFYMLCAALLHFYWQLIPLYWQPIPSPYIFGSMLVFSFIPYTILLSFFFYLDSDGSLKKMPQSFANGVKMVIYNYLFWFASGLFFIALYLVLIILIGACLLCFLKALVFLLLVIKGDVSSLLLTTLYQIALLSSMKIFTLISYIFIICWCNNFYTKKVHEQFSLYFKHER